MPRTYATGKSGGGTPGGLDTQVQFNDGGSFGGDADFVFDKTTNLLTLAGPMLVQRYLNFGTVQGEAGYGIKEDAFGGMYFKHNGNPDWQLFIGFPSFSADAPLQYDGGGDFSMTQADRSTNGWLSAGNFQLFDDKVSSPWSVSGSDIYYNAGNIGIGGIPTTDPLTVYQYMRFSDSLGTNVAQVGLNVDGFENLVFQYSNTKAIRFYADNSEDGPEFQFFGGSHPTFPGQIYFDYGSGANDLTGLASLNIRMLFPGSNITAASFDSVGDTHLYGNLQVDGKVTSGGGYDPIYVLYDTSTVERFLECYADEIPEHKRGGMAIWFNGTDLMGYQGSTGNMYQIPMNLIGNYQLN